MLTLSRFARFLHARPHAVIALRQPQLELKPFDRERLIAATEGMGAAV